MVDFSFIYFLPYLYFNEFRGNFFYSKLNPSIEGAKGAKAIDFNFHLTKSFVFLLGQSQENVNSIFK